MTFALIMQTAAMASGAATARCPPRLNPVLQIREDFASGSGGVTFDPSTHIGFAQSNASTGTETDRGQVAVRNGRVEQARREVELLSGLKNGQQPFAHSSPRGEGAGAGAGEGEGIAERA